MQSASHLQKVLKKGSVAYGAWQMLAGTNLARQMARAGVDWICVDTEHGNIDDGAMHEAVTAIAATSVSPMVRIAAAEPWMVKRALDSGAHAIMVPLLQTPEEVRRLVSATKFPPRGSRGFGSPFAQGSFTPADKPLAVPGAVEYLQSANDTILTVIQIETREALENVEAIAAVDGVDVLFVGPFDLGNNIGHPILGKMDEELKMAIDKIHEAATKAGKWSGIYCTSGDQAREYADKGFKMMNVSGDVIALQNHVAQNLEAAKGTVMHQALNVAKGAASKISGSGGGGPYGK